jgi:hypothetical protein
VKRRLFNMLAAISLVLCMATGALWMTNCFRGFVAEGIWGNGFVEVNAEWGLVTLVVVWPDRANWNQSPFFKFYQFKPSHGEVLYEGIGVISRRTTLRRSLWNCGFAYFHEYANSLRNPEYIVIFPKWFLMMVAMALASHI